MYDLDYFRIEGRAEKRGYNEHSCDRPEEDDDRSDPHGQLARTRWNSVSSFAYVRFLFTRSTAAVTSRASGTSH